VLADHAPGADPQLAAARLDPRAVAERRAGADDHLRPRRGAHHDVAAHQHAGSQLHAGLAAGAENP
jgi:hypothetical protein